MVKEKIRAFFSGRNGADSLANTCMWGAVILILVSGFVGIDWLRSLLGTVAWSGLIYGYFRVLSKNVYKRQSENAAFMAWKGQLKQRWTQRKTHKFYRCPKCRTVLRVPKGKGKISITCRSCGEKFIKTT